LNLIDDVFDFESAFALVVGRATAARFQIEFVGESRRQRRRASLARSAQDDRRCGQGRAVEQLISPYPIA
jgi:hypothetical protein